MFHMTIDVIHPLSNRTINTKTHELKYLDDAGPALRNYKNYAQALGLLVKLVGIVEVDD